MPGATTEHKMKNKKNLLGLFVLLFALGLLFSGCDNGTTGGGGGGGAGGPCDSIADLGPPLVLSGQVYIKDDSSLAYSNYKPGHNLDISDFNYQGSGMITSNGQLSFSIGAPDSECLWSFDAATLEGNLEFAEFMDYYTDLTCTPSSGVYGYILTTLVAWEGPTFFINENETLSISGNSASGTSEKLVFVYVGADVTFSGKGKTLNYGPVTSTSADFSLALKQGWNALSVKDESLSTISGTATGTEAITLSNPHLNWILEYNF